jgi:hypothetical protein
LLLLLGIARLTLGRRPGIGSRFLSDASSTHKYLCLEQLFSLARFTLHVVDGVAMLNVGVEPENHSDFAIW